MIHQIIRLQHIQEEIIKARVDLIWIRKSFLKNRFSDLANSSYNRNIYTYTDFLNLNEISILNSYKNQLPPVNVELAGGNDYAERRIAVFFT